LTVLRCRIADLARSRGITAEALSLTPSSDSGRGLQPPSNESTPSTYARRDEAREATEVVLADVLETRVRELLAERSYRDVELLELLFCRGTSQQEAARLLGTSEPTVSRMRKANLERLQELVRRHSLSDALDDRVLGEATDGLIRRVWEENGLTAFSRATLGDYALGVLPADEADFVRFRLEVLRCECCSAHLESLLDEDRQGLSARARETIFQSSVGYLR
jgi:RNA polymerase sigma factor (sigma-70 family)